MGTLQIFSQGMDLPMANKAYFLQWGIVFLEDNENSGGGGGFGTLVGGCNLGSLISRFLLRICLLMDNNTLKMKYNICFVTQPNYISNNFNYTFSWNIIRRWRWLCPFYSWEDHSWCYSTIFCYRIRFCSYTWWAIFCTYTFNVATRYFDKAE